MKVIFLDIDGVLNTADSMYMDRFIPCEDIDGQIVPDHLSYRSVRILNDIIKETGAKVVISSTWRLGRSVEWLQKLLDRYGFEGEVIGRTGKLWDECRGAEIQQWLDVKTDYDIESFIIIDDDSDMAHLLGHLVHTEIMLGLYEKHKKQSIKTLNYPNKWHMMYYRIKHNLRRSKNGFKHYIWWNFWRSPQIDRKRRKELKNKAKEGINNEYCRINKVNK